MFITAILMLLMLACLLASERKDYKGLRPFDKTNTLPLRGLLALLIVSHHLGQRTGIFPLSNFTVGIGMPIVAVFFFISGYGLCYSFAAKGRTYLDGFLQKRMGKLLPKFLFLTLGMVLAYQFFTNGDILWQIAKVKRGWTPLPFSWFIYVIIYVYIAFYICALIAKTPKRTGLLFTLSLSAYIGVCSEILYFPSYWYVTVLCTSLGYYVALYEKKIDTLFRRKFLAYSSMAAFLFISFCVMAKVRVPSLSFALTIMWLFALALSTYVLIRSLGFADWKWLCYVGTFSLELYLVHGLPLMIGQHLGLQNWPLWIFTYSLAIPIAILLNRAYDLVAYRIKAQNLN